MLREELLGSALDEGTAERLIKAHRLLPREGRPPDPVHARGFVTILSSLLTQYTSLRLPGLSVRTPVVGPTPQHPQLVRPAAVLLPYCFFAYRRSLFVTPVALVALATSTAGATAHLVPALAGLLLVNSMVIVASRLVARRRTEARRA